MKKEWISPNITKHSREDINILGGTPSVVEGLSGKVIS